MDPRLLDVEKKVPDRRTRVGSVSGFSGFRRGRLAASPLSMSHLGEVGGNNGSEAEPTFISGKELLLRSITVCSC